MSNTLVSKAVATSSKSRHTVLGAEEQGLFILGPYRGEAAAAVAATTVAHEMRRSAVGCSAGLESAIPGEQKSPRRIIHQEYCFCFSFFIWFSFPFLLMLVLMFYCYHNCR